MEPLTDEQRERYGRQILLDRIGEEGQKRLLGARVLLVGAGGLGAPAGLYLAGAGVGQVTIADGDTVMAGNLHRQVVHTEERVGWNKAESAAAALRARNSDVAISPLPRALEGDLLRDMVTEADLVVDASDNFATRYAVNAACLAAGVPLVSGAVIRAEGQVMVLPFDTDPEAACYRCTYREPPPSDTAERCAVTGVLGPAAGMIGTIMAAEAIKHLTGCGSALAGRLLIVDAMTMDFRQIGLARDPECPACSTSPPPATDN